MASTLAYGLNYVANQQIKQIIDDLKSDNTDDLYTNISLPIFYTNEQLKKTTPYMSVGKKN